MTRYIDADSLREYWLHNGKNERVYNTNDFLDSIDYQPTADVQPVVHCVKCKYRNDISVCILNSIFINENDYCSNGELDGDEHD